MTRKKKRLLVHVLQCTMKKNQQTDVVVQMGGRNSLNRVGSFAFLATGFHHVDVAGAFGEHGRSESTVRRVHSYLSLSWTVSAIRWNVISVPNRHDRSLNGRITVPVSFSTKRASYLSPPETSFNSVSKSTYSGWFSVGLTLLACVR